MTTIRRLLFAIGVVAASITFSTISAADIAPGVSQGCTGGNQIKPGIGQPCAAACSEATVFLARTSGLNGTHTSAYTNLICGLVTDGIWSKLDVLYIHATQDQTTANLNLKSSSFTITTTGTPTWGADVGYTTAAGKWADTNWNPATDGSQFTQNAAHIGVWSGTTGLNFQPTIGLKTTSNGSLKLTTRSSGDISAVFVNDTTAVTTPASVDGSGFWLGVRTDASTKQIWRNGTQQGGDITRASAAVQSFVLQTSGDNVNSGNSSANIIRAMSAGNKLSPTEIGNYYTRMASYMIAVGASP